MFLVLLGKKPKKEFEELDDKTKELLVELFKVLEVNPWPAKKFDLCKLEGMEDCYRIRMGRYRIWYHVNTASLEITIFRLGMK